MFSLVPSLDHILPAPSLPAMRLGATRALGQPQPLARPATTRRPHHQPSSVAASGGAPRKRMAGSGGISPARRRAHDEAAPLVGPAADSPSMGSLKHRGGSLGDVVVAGAGSDERGGLPGSAPARATLFGLTPAVLLCVAVRRLARGSWGLGVCAPQGSQRCCSASGCLACGPTCCGFRLP